VAKPEWGAKRTCTSCGTKFYDFSRAPIHCPACGAVYEPEVALKVRRPRADARSETVRPKAAAVVAVADDEDELLDEDEELDEEEAEEVEDDAEELDAEAEAEPRAAKRKKRRPVDEIVTLPDVALDPDAEDDDVADEEEPDEALVEEEEADIEEEIEVEIDPDEFDKDT